MRDDAYGIWLSEVMLQQTQVQTVIPYFQRFLARFPTVIDLARAKDDDVMALWAGLGYYTRARNLLACARMIDQQYSGQFPSDPKLLEALPGIGRSTAAAIASSAFGVAAPILDGNVKRVFSRIFGIEADPSKAEVTRLLWTIAQEQMPTTQARQYNQALMDLGAGLCSAKKPTCAACPLAEDCIARQQNKLEEIPFKKKRKSIPTRTRWFFAVSHQKEILLQRLPSHGVWGGLYCLPFCEASDAGLTLKEAMQSVLGPLLGNQAEHLSLPSIDGLKPVYEFDHSFTHFRLRGQIYSIELGDRSSTQVFDSASRHQWFSALSLSQVGLPKPLMESLHALGWMRYKQA